MDTECTLLPCFNLCLLPYVLDLSEYSQKSFSLYLVPQMSRQALMKKTPIEFTGHSGLVIFLHNINMKQTKKYNWNCFKHMQYKKKNYASSANPFRCSLCLKFMFVGCIKFMFAGCIPGAHHIPSSLTTALEADC